MLTAVMTGAPDTVVFMAGMFHSNDHVLAWKKVLQLGIRPQRSSCCIRDVGLSGFWQSC